MPSEQLGEEDESNISYSYPTQNTDVNDYADFLSGDDGEDIKFTGSSAAPQKPVKNDIADFTLSQGGVNKR